MANVQRVIPTPLGHSVAKVVRGSTIFEDAQSCYLTRTPSTAGNKRTSTRSYWIKFTQPDDDYDVTVITGGGSSGNYRYHSGLNSNKTYYRYERLDGNDKVDVNTGSACYRDYGSWYHFVEVIDTPRTTAADRFRFYVNGSRVDLTFNTSYPQNYEGLVNDPTPNHIGARYDASNDELCANMCEHYFLDGQSLGPEYFGYTDPLTGNWRPKKYTQGVFKEMDKWTCDTYNSWNSGQTSLRYQGIKFLTSDGGKVGWRATGSSNTGLNVYTSTDNSTWTRKLSSVTVDSTGLYYESSEQYVIIVNGSDANWSNEQVVISDQNGAKLHYSNGTYPGNGSPTMSWTGPAYSDGTLGSYNSFYLPLDGTGFSAFQTDGNRVQDQSGLQNNHTSNGSPTFTTDSPSGVSNSIDTTAGITTTGFPSNYAQLNPLRRFTHNCNLSGGDLKATGSSDSYPGISANAELTSGKWYYEFVINTKTSNPMCGVCDNNYMSGGSGRVLYRANGYYVLADGSEPSDPDTFGAGDIIGVAINLDDTAGYIRFYKNGALQTAVAGLNALKSDLNVSKARGGLIPYIQMYTSDVCTVNYGQNVFQYTPPDGHRPICTANLNMEGDGISNPSLYSYNTTYTGNGTSNSSLKMVTGVGFQPDFVWIKAVSSTWPHMIFDTVKGRRQNNATDSFWYSMTDSANSGYQYGSSDQVSEMTPDGFNVQGYSGYSNTDGASYWAWCLKAGGGNMKGSSGNEFWRNDQKYSTAALAGVGGGTITPTACSVGVPQGFSMIQFDGNATNSTVAHGLSKPPEFILIKNGHSPNDWAVYHVGLHDTTPQDYYAEFNTTATATDDSTYWNDTAPTSSVFSVGTSVNTNTDQAENRSMAWCWHSVPGMQRFGWYYGTSNSDGPIVKLGFRPGVIMVKKRDGTENWQLHTTSRNPYNHTSNAAGNRFFINLTTAETTQANLDILSDGFKIRTTDASVNSNNEEYMYCAWAEQSSSGQYGGQATGR